MRHVTRCLTVTLAGCLCSSSLLANPEPPVLTDGRSNAMGHTGVATDDYATGTYHNPAVLGAVKTVGVTASVTPVYAKLKAPFPNATGGFDSKDSEPIIAPLGTLGFGYRVHERVVVGLGAFVTSATGARYTGVVAGRDVDAAAFAAEFHLPVAVNVTDDFSVGAAYRVTFARLGITAPALVPG